MWVWGTPFGCHGAPSTSSLKQDLAFKSNGGQRLFLLGVIHVSLPVSVWVFLCDSKLTLGVNLSVCGCLCLLAMSWRLVHGVPSVFPGMESVPNRDPAKGWCDGWWIDATPLGLSGLAKAGRWHIQWSTVHVLVWETCQRSAHSTKHFKST